MRVAIPKGQKSLSGSADQQIHSNSFARLSRSLSESFAASKAVRAPEVRAAPGFQGLAELVEAVVFTADGGGLGKRRGRACFTDAVDERLDGAETSCMPAVWRISPFGSFSNSHNARAGSTFPSAPKIHGENDSKHSHSGSLIGDIPRNHWSIFSFSQNVSPMEAFWSWNCRIFLPGSSSCASLRPCNRASQHSR